jgi:hypothetical protein
MSRRNLARRACDDDRRENQHDLHGTRLVIRIASALLVLMVAGAAPALTNTHPGEATDPVIAATP